MTRPIKYRAWDKQNKQMFYVCELHINKDGVKYVKISGWRDLPAGSRTGFRKKSEYLFTEHMELMEFTGLTDNNGVEIFEGDIVHIAGYDGVVRFEKTRWIADGYAIKGGDVYGELDDCCEVIGNIYEHENLIQGEQR